MAPADVGLVGLDRQPLGLALLQLDLVEAGLQHLQRLGAVLMLAALLLDGNGDAGGNVGDAHGRIGLVDVLAARARGAVGVDAQVLVDQLDLDVVVDLGIDPDRCKAGLAPCIAVERRDAHEAMHARFGLQPAVGVRPLDLEGAGLDARLFAGAFLEPAHLESAAFGPARIHARQHLGPVLGLGAASAGIDLDIGVVGIGLARQQGLQARLGGFSPRLGQPALRVGDHRLVLLGLGDFDQPDVVVDRGAQALDGGDRGFEPRALLHHGLRLLLVVPKRRILGARVQFGETYDGLVVVKDAS